MEHNNVCDRVELITLWNGIWCRTKYCHSSNFQHPSLTISHPQIPTTEGQAFVYSQNENCETATLLGLSKSCGISPVVVLIRKLLRPYMAESCLQPAMTSLLTDFVWMGFLLGEDQLDSARRESGPEEATPGEGELCWALPHLSTHCEHILRGGSFLQFHCWIGVAEAQGNTAVVTLPFFQKVIGTWTNPFKTHVTSVGSELLSLLIEQRWIKGQCCYRLLVINMSPLESIFILLASS